MSTAASGAVHIWCAVCHYGYDLLRGTTPGCPVCGSREFREHRRHDVDMLEKIARLHGPTPITELTADGVQARAWYVASRLPGTDPHPRVDKQQALAAIIGFYASLFEVNPAEVARDIRALYEPGTDGWEAGKLAFPGE